MSGRSEHSLAELMLSFHHVGPRDGSRAVQRGQWPSHQHMESQFLIGLLGFILIPVLIVLQSLTCS